MPSGPCKLTLEQQYRLAARLGLFAHKACRCPGRTDHKPSCTLLEIGECVYVYDFSTATKKPVTGFFTTIDSSMLDTPIERSSPVITAMLTDLDETTCRYFNTYQISLDTLKQFPVKAVQQLFKNEESVYTWSDNDPMYAYLHESGRRRYYRPLNARYKWSGNWRIGDIFGYSPFVEKHALLLLTSSAKDVMALHELGFKAFALGSETVSNNVLEGPIMAARARRNEIVLMFDSDDVGKAHATRISSRFGIPYILPQAKDISDQLKHQSIHEVRQYVMDSLSAVTRCVHAK